MSSNEFALGAVKSLSPKKTTTACCSKQCANALYKKKLPTCSIQRLE